ncbi:MAG: hypothetical protein AAF468_20865 [Pseudomonadota bacterium]
MESTEKSKSDDSAQSAAQRYFEAVDEAFDGLDLFLSEDQSPLYQHALMGKVISGHLDRLRHSFDAWRNRLAFVKRFRISQAESGFPVFQNVLDLENDQKDAESRLASMPDGDTLRHEMLDFILKKQRFPEALQKSMAERLYLEELKGGKLFSPLVLPETVRVSVNPKTGRPFYVVHWASFDGSANLPLIYVATIEDSSDRIVKMLVGSDGELNSRVDIPLPVDGLLNPELAHQFDSFCENNSSYALTLSTIASNLDKDFQHLHPKQLRRFVLGPFYGAGVTNHGHVVQRILENVKHNKNAWLLSWTMQEIFSVSETPAKWGLWSSTPARESFHINTDDLECARQGVSNFERSALVPHEAYQAIYAENRQAEIFEGYRTHIISGGHVLHDM